MTEEIKVKNVAHVVFEGFTTLDMYGPVQAHRPWRITALRMRRISTFC